MGTRAQVRDAGRLTGDALARVVDVVREIHETVADRAFEAVGPVAAPVRAVHDVVTSATYATVHAAHAVIPRAGTQVAAYAMTDGTCEASPAAANSTVLDAVNGIWGDTVSGRYPALAVPMTLRREGADRPMDLGRQTASEPDVSGRLVVFVHGLCENDRSWARGSGRRDAQPGGTYGTRLRDDLGMTPLYLRYNSGLHVSDNGQALAVLLDRLVAGWPVPVKELVLVGHSMGGLVVRSACHYGDEAGHSWVPAVRHVVCLGTPHLGAPLEKGVHLLSWALRQAPETRPEAGLLDGRSAGVHDLRFGACVEEDWGLAGDGLLQDRCTDVAFLPHAAYHFVAATVAQDTTSRTARLTGDLMVRMASASGAGRHRTVPFASEQGATLGGVGHLALLNDPAVYAVLRDWLSATSRRTVSSG